MSADTIKEPASLSEVEELILTLYQPVPPAVITRVQDILHRLQKSPQAWSLARDLLSRPNEKIRFFGALTLIVKLNTDSSSLGEAESNELFAGLLSWLLEAALDGSSGLVTRKLSSALVTFFLHYPSRAQLCLRHLLCCLFLRRLAGPEEIVDPAQLVQALEPRVLETAILFATDLVDEAGKVDLSSSKYVSIYDAIRGSVQDVAALLYAGLRAAPTGGPADLTLKVCSIKCLLSWASFSCRFFPGGDPLLDTFRALIPSVMEVLALSDDILVAALELFSELLTHFPRFLTPAQHRLLLDLCESPLGAEHYNRLIEGDADLESFEFGLFMLALGDDQTPAFLLTPVDDRAQALLEKLCGLLTAPSYPVAEDRIFVPAVEFWSSFAASLADEMAVDEHGRLPDGCLQGKAQANTAVYLACRRIRLPPYHVFAEWDSAERDGFIDARRDVADLIQTMYTVSGHELVASFLDRMVNALKGTDWMELEAAAFCLGALADCLAGDSAGDEVVRTVFTPDFFSVLRHEKGSVPPRTRQSCIALVEKFADVFERSVSSLPDVLNLLFSVVDDPVLAGSASKSILRLCSECRGVLVPEASAFLTQYRTIVTERQVDCLANERITGAIGSVIQAIGDDGPRIAATHQLLDILSEVAQRCIFAAANPQQIETDAELQRCGPRCLEDVTPAELPLHVCLRVLRCLVCLGKGLQVLPEQTLTSHSPEQPQQPGLNSEPLRALQSRIMMIISELQATFPGSGEVVESICSIFKTGFSESTPGPFVFPPDVVCNYLLHQQLSNPRIGALVSMACSFVSSMTPKDPSWKETVNRVLGWVIGLIRGLPDIDTDPELSQNAIEFASRLFTRDPGAVLLFQPNDSLAFLFSFTLTVLDGQEPLPKASAAEFWATFMSHKTQDQNYQALIQQAMAELGPAVTLSLVRNVGGNASRSELDKLSEPIKKITSLYPMGQSWIQAALFHPTFPGREVSDEDKSAFVKKLIQGSRMTNQVVKEFWLTSRGSKFKYAT